ncbi:MAG: TRAP transporter small permease [Burkholderiaceae bacterium]|nr:TRAP transporter small permease [Burkholderiaceae bacterium]
METASSTLGRKLLPRAERLLVQLNQGVIILLMATMAAFVFANVVSRYVFNHSMVWVEELTQYQMIWITWLGAGLALRQGRHVAVDVLQDALPASLRAALRWAIVAIMLAFLAALAWYGAQIVAFSWNQETPMLGIRTGIPYLGIPIGAVLFALHLVAFAREFVGRRFEHVDEPGAGE